MTTQNTPMNSAYPTQKHPFNAQLDELSHLVGNTPLFRVQNLNVNPRVSVYAKLEWQQFGGSVKARAAYRIMQHAIRTGDLTPNKRLLDASSGNTGIAYAIFAAVAQIGLTLCIPENASAERKHILKTLGAEVRFTSPFESTDGAQEVAKELAAANPDQYYYADQYNNPNNWQAHYFGTAQEIWLQTDEQITHFISGLGTTGTFTGTGTRLKELNPDIQLIGLQPETAMHGLEGWKHLETAKVPGIYNDQLADEVRYVDTMDAYHTLERAASEEGLFLSPSAAANLDAALKLANELDEGVIVTVLADDASKYGEVTRKIFQS